MAQLIDYAIDAVRFFHRTSKLNAHSILRDGWKDGFQVIGSLEMRGVWLSVVPLGSSEGAGVAAADAHVLLAVEGLQEEGVRDFEFVEDGKPYREWCVPSALLNACAQTRLLDEAH